MHFNSEVAIHLVGVTKTYRVKEGEIRALNRVSLDIPWNRIFCLLGPNGAGKTTLIKILSGVLLPDDGSISINGFDLKKARKKALRDVGIIFETVENSYGYLTVEENLLYFGYLNHIPQRLLRERISEEVELLGLSDKLKTPANFLSKGMRRKLAIAIALLKRPKILYLDEPTLGLDIFTQEKIRDVLKEWGKQKGHTLLLTTHDLNFAQELGDEFAFINKGNIIWEGSKENLSGFSFYKKFYKIKVKSFNGNISTISCNEERLNPTIESLRKANFDIISISLTETDLKEIFKQLLR